MDVTQGTMEIVGPKLPTPKGSLPAQAQCTQQGGHIEIGHRGVSHHGQVAGRCGSDVPQELV